MPGGDDRSTGFSLSFMMTVMEIMMMGRETLAWHTFQPLSAGKGSCPSLPGLLALHALVKMSRYL